MSPVLPRRVSSLRGTMRARAVPVLFTGFENAHSQRRAPSPGWFLVPYSLRWFVSLCRAILGLAIGHTREAVLMVRAEATAHAKRPGRLRSLPELGLSHRHLASPDADGRGGAPIPC